MGLISSVVKSLRLRAVSKELGAPIPRYDLQAWLEGAAVRDDALERLLDIVLSDGTLRQVVARHTAGRDTLRSVYKRLLNIGAGGWRRGHWVPASSFAFGPTLDYALSHLAGDDSLDHNTAVEVAFALVSYFENGKVGVLPPLRTESTQPAPSSHGDPRASTPLYKIADVAPSQEFKACWQAAGNHLNDVSRGLDRHWVRAELSAPSHEHLSFRLGNQLFLVRVGDVDRRLAGPGSLVGLLSTADECKAFPCLLSMRRGQTGWRADRPGWGLVHARTGEPIDPPSLVTTERIEMTDWEVHDFAVQIVRDSLREKGLSVGAWQGNPRIDPSIWYAESGEKAWVVVRAVRFPVLAAALPPHWSQIVEDCEPVSSRGFFASVAVAGGEESTGDSPDVRLLRGRPLYARYTGLTVPTPDDIEALEEERIGRGRLASRRNRPPPGSRQRHWE